MRPIPPLLALIGTLAPLPVPAAAQGPGSATPTTLGNGLYEVDVNAFGVLVGAPETGLATMDGPQVLLQGRPSEWFGVAFEGPGGRREGVGPGAEPDWAGRPPVERVSLRAGTGELAAHTRLGPLAIETRFQFDPREGYLAGSAVLENAGDRPLGDLVYTREWREPGRMGGSFPPGHGLPPAPREIFRMVWTLDRLPPGGAWEVRFRYAPKPTAVATAADGGVDVPLSIWTSAVWPFGVQLGDTNGISWGDYNGDDWIDIFCHASGNMWRNMGGTAFLLPVDFNIYLPPAALRYGASFGDYNNDGFQDIATEPRNAVGGDRDFHLLKNLASLSFLDVALNPSIVVGQPQDADSETICWGDVDGDELLDLFLPVYPFTAAMGPGNFFLHNQGQGGFFTEYTFVEKSGPAGLDNPPGHARPEGAQFCDWDFDGDLDLFSNMALYQNRSLVGTPSFTALHQSVTGVTAVGHLDEGAAFWDYDLDGDFDLFIAHIESAFGVRIWENRGDGTFFLEDGLIQAPKTGLGLGLSYEDWDNDGDIDFTTREVFRRNMLIETGSPGYVVATHNITPLHINSATPAWGDWDKDGDLDCAVGNYFSTGRFYQNDLYSAATPLADRRYVRVRPVRDWPGINKGLDNEYGAVVRLHVAGEDVQGPRRVKFTASGHGYLNQNEYTLTFGLPPDPVPADPQQDLVFDVSVDFPSLPEQGTWRVDKHVNPVLGGVELATLTQREIKVYRSGRVILNGVDSPPVSSLSPRLETTTGGLVMADATPLPAPTAVAADTWVGLEIDTHGATAPLRGVELVLDAQLAPGVTCGGNQANIVLWEFTDPSAPIPVQEASTLSATSPRNDRHHVRTDFVLQAGRVYRLAARVTERRTTAVAGPGPGQAVVTGGLEYVDPSPCDSTAIAAATVDPSAVSLALRYRPEPQVWTDLGNGLAGSQGVPQLTGVGTLKPGQGFALQIAGAAPNAQAILVYGNQAVYLPLLDGVLVPLPQGVNHSMTTNALGNLLFPSSWPLGVPPGVTLYFQFGVIDPGAPLGLAATNGLLGIGQ